MVTGTDQSALLPAYIKGSAIDAVEKPQAKTIYIEYRGMANYMRPDFSYTRAISELKALLEWLTEFLIPGGQFLEIEPTPPSPSQRNKRPAWLNKFNI